MPSTYGINGTADSPRRSKAGDLCQYEPARVYLRHEIGSDAHGEHSCGNILRANGSMVRRTRASLV